MTSSCQLASDSTSARLDSCGNEKSYCEFFFFLTCCLPYVCLHLQSRSPKHGPSPQPGVGDQVDHLSLASLESLDTMSEADTPCGFTRGTRIRASLPVVRSTNQTKDRSLGMTGIIGCFALFCVFCFQAMDCDLPESRSNCCKMQPVIFES